MNSFNYFSYGSNMLIERLQARCPGARLVGCGEARGYRLDFFKRSKDGSGKAMPRAVDDNKQRLHGLLFEIPVKERGDLDKAEGEGYGYDRQEDFPIHLAGDGTKLDVTTYIANSKYIDVALKPFDWYLALVIAGARQHGLPEAYIENMCSVPCEMTVPEPGNRGREQALEALRASGYDNFQQLLLPR